MCASSFLGMRLPEIPAGHWQIADFGPQKLRPDVRGELVQFGLSIALLLTATKTWRDCKITLKALQKK